MFKSITVIINLSKEGRTVSEQQIVDLFMSKVFGEKADTSNLNQEHDGKKGHWLETQMGVKRNRKTAPDLLGYEMKDGTSSKVSFGDWSADYYLFDNEELFPNTENLNRVQRREKFFLPVFGKPNEKKEGRLSWSGEPIPKINQYSTFGTILTVDQNDNILITYSFSKDQRENKNSIVPTELQVDDLILATWYADSMRTKVNDKFNQKGWFVCKKDKKTHIYNQIGFGNPIPFEDWIDMVRTGDIFFDSGMYQGNKRPYSQWRANNTTIDKLLVKVYP